MGKNGGVKSGGVFSACAEVNRGETVYEREPRKRLRLTRANFFEIVKANFVAAREIMIEFVFSLCENGCVPGSVTAPHRTDSIIRLTRGRPGERFVRALRGESSTGLAVVRA